MVLLVHRRILVRKIKGDAMQTITINKDGRELWRGEYASKAEAVAAYRKDLGAEAFDYDAVNPRWIDDLEVSIQIMRGLRITEV